MKKSAKVNDESRAGPARRTPPEQAVAPRARSSALRMAHAEAHGELPVQPPPGASAGPSLRSSLMWAAGAVALLVAASAATVYTRNHGPATSGKSPSAAALQAPREREAIAAVAAPVASIDERSAKPMELASAATPGPSALSRQGGESTTTAAPRAGGSASAAPQPPPASDASASLTRWEYVGPIGVPQRHYTFLAATRSGLFAATFNNSSQDGAGSDVYFLVPRTSSERLVITVPAKPFTGFSGLAVDESRDAVFVSLDQGSAAESAVYRFTLGGPAAEGFGTGGKLALNRRPLGCAVSADALYVLVDWGFVLKLDPETGAQQGAPIELQSSTFLRDITINGAELGAYGNGNYVEFNLPGASVIARKQLLPNSTPRATEGIGMNPATGEFIVRPIDTPDLLTIKRGEVLSTPVEPTQLSRHTVDFACAPDGSALFVSDLLRKEIIRYRRAAPHTTTALPATTATSTP